MASMVTKPGYEVANVENTPNGAYLLGPDSQTGNGYKFPTAWGNPAVNLDDAQLVRFGFWVKNPTGTTSLESVRLAAVFELRVE